MFKCVKTTMGFSNYPNVVYIAPVTDESITEGEALSLSGGKLTKTSGSAKYIAGKSGTNCVIPVYEVSEHDVYEATLTSDPSAMNIGDKLLLSTDGLNVAAKSDSGVAEIVAFPEGKALNNKVYVKLI